MTLLFLTHDTKGTSSQGMHSLVTYQTDDIAYILHHTPIYSIDILENNCVNHKEGYTANHSNFYVFFDTNDNNRAIFIPDGMNYFRHTSEAQVFSDFVNAELPRRLSRIPETAQRFETELNRLLTEVWDAAALLTLVDNLAIQVQTGQRPVLLGDPRNSNKDKEG